MRPSSKQLTFILSCNLEWFRVYHNIYSRNECQCKKQSETDNGHIDPYVALCIASTTINHRQLAFICHTTITPNPPLLRGHFLPLTYAYLSPVLAHCRSFPLLYQWVSFSQIVMNEPFYLVTLISYLSLWMNRFLQLHGKQQDSQL